MIKGTRAADADPYTFTREALRELARALSEDAAWLGAQTEGTEPQARRRRELLKRLTRLRGQFEMLWGELARDSALKCAARARAAPNADLRQLYGLAIDCAEEVYGAVARTDRYAKTQAELINTVAALRIHGRRSRPAEGANAAARGPDAPREAGCSLREPAWRRDNVVLYRYVPLPGVQSVRSKPILMSYALVNRPYVLDLQPDRSLIRSLLAAGLTVYMIDWGYPQEPHRRLGLRDYVDGYLGASVRHILKVHKSRSVNLLGVCQGGTLGLCYSARHPERVANLVLLATPVDFQTDDNLLSFWARDLDARRLVRAGNVPGRSLTALFMALSPFRLTQQKYLTLLEQRPDSEALELFGRMERWIFDSPDLAATAFGQFLRWFYQENRLIRGTLEFAGRRVDLAHINQPVLNIYATRDHIVPPSASLALRQYIGSRDYTTYAVDTGHIGLYVSSRACQSVPAQIAAWLRRRAPI